jgi:hypothetical protein
MFNRILSLHNKLYSKEFVILGTIVGFVGGGVNFVEYQFDKLSYFDKLSNFVEGAHKKPELVESLAKLNSRTNEIKANSDKSGFFQSISDGIELGEISNEQKKILDRLQCYDNLPKEFVPPSHPWLNLNDSFSTSLSKSLLFCGVIGGGVSTFYYLTLPVIGLYSGFNRYVDKQFHDKEMKKLENKIDEKN